MRSVASIKEIEKKLGHQLEIVRLSKGIRQIDLAIEAGISRPTLSRIERGMGGTFESIIRIMRALEIDDRLDFLIPDASKNPLLTDANGNFVKERVRISVPKNTGPWVWGDQKSDGSR